MSVLSSYETFLQENIDTADPALQSVRAKLKRRTEHGTKIQIVDLKNQVTRIILLIKSH